MYSQNNEEKIILDFFKGHKGTFLDIGAFDGINLSNTRRLAELGWEGVCIEPDPIVFGLLCKNYLDNKLVKCYEYALGEKSGEVKFYSNQNAVGTMVKEQTDRWKGTQDYTEVEVEVKSIPDFLEENQTSFDFISIDAEGMDYYILTNLPLKKIGCRLVCVEHNGLETNKYMQHLIGLGYSIIHVNAENIIAGL